MNGRSARSWSIVVVLATVGALVGSSVVRADDPQDRLRLVYRHALGCADDDAESAYLGVHVREEFENPEGGARIIAVSPDSPAARAGLQAGDVIVRFGEEIIRGPARLTRAIHAREPGERVTVEFVRDGESGTVEVEIASRSELCPHADVLIAPEGRELDEATREQLRARAEEWAERARELAERHYELEVAPGLGYRLRFLRDWDRRPLLGVELVEITPELRRHLGATEDVGVLVGKVLDGTPAEAAGIRVGDVIVAVDDASIGDTTDLREALADAEGRTARLRIVRDRQEIEIPAEIPGEDDPPSGPRA